MFAGHDSKLGVDDIVYLAINPYWGSMRITLPLLSKEMMWHLAVDTADYTNNKFIYEESDMKMVGNEYWMGARSVVVLVAKEMDAK